MHVYYKFGMHWGRKNTCTYVVLFCGTCTRVNNVHPHTQKRKKNGKENIKKRKSKNTYKRVKWNKTWKNRYIHSFQFTPSSRRPVMICAARKREKTQKNANKILSKCVAKSVQN